MHFGLGHLGSMLKFNVYGRLFGGSCAAEASIVVEVI